VLRHPNIITGLTSGMNSPYLPTRKLLAENLTFAVLWEEYDVRPNVISALETLSTTNNEPSGSPYAYWFKSLNAAFLNRGKMGSLVGASEEARRNAGVDASMHEYAVRCPKRTILPLRGV
jgi:cytokinesis protein